MNRVAASPAKMRVAVVTTHPIQYQVPWLRLLAAHPGIELQVYFAMIPDSVEQGREFGVAFEWDVPLLEGYQWQVLENRSPRPSLTEFGGCDTPSIRAEIRRGRFDAVIVNGWVVKTCIQALIACRLTGTACIVRGEVNGLQERVWWKRLGHRLLLSQYGSCLSIGRNNRRYLLERGVAEDAIFSTPYCVDNPFFAAGAQQWLDSEGREALRRRFGLDARKPVFMFSGKFVDKKRPGDIVDAVRMLESTGELDFEVLMVGDGPLGAELRERSQGLPISYAGFLNQSQITAAYAAADALVLPSDAGETWGLVVNEAMACGLPAFVSDKVGCAVDLVEEGRTGSVFACGDVASLAATLNRAAAEPEKLRQQGQAAAARVHADYNFQRVLEGVLSALSRVRREVER
jgi:glycosyltransferase involved in cell wall biosynthesis